MFIVTLHLDLITICKVSLDGDSLIYNGFNTALIHLFNVILFCHIQCHECTQQMTSMNNIDNAISHSYLMQCSITMACHKGRTSELPNITLVLLRKALTVCHHIMHSSFVFM